MKIAYAQINCLMGDVAHNSQKIKTWIKKASIKKVDLLIFPEMTISSYPPLDLLNYKFFLKQVKKTIQKIHQSLPPQMTILLGAPYFDRQKTFNSVFCLQKNKTIKIFSKKILVDHNVFDELRYFTPDTASSNFFYLNKNKILVLICEEMWQFKKLVNRVNFLKKSPQIIICLNASPFYVHKVSLRKKTAQKIAKLYQCPLIYVNSVGSHEELIFDGGSFILNAKGQTIQQADFFKESLTIISEKSLSSTSKQLKKITPSFNHQIKEALIFGIQEFVKKNQFQKVHLGLSGGIDSALTAWLSIQALGVKKVVPLFLPGPWTAKKSFLAIKKLISNFQVKVYTQDITPLYKQFLKSWQLTHKSFPSSLVKENLQARIRSLYLMAWANQHPESLLLGTSNKTELALGYATLYGDLSGGLFPIGDLFKTEVYQIAKTLKNPAIPSLILNRPPTAELKPRQQDIKDLPANYPTLDLILKKIVEQKKDPTSRLEKKIFQSICLSEFKRRQTAPLLKVKEFSFDKGWRWPLSVKKMF